VAHWYCFSTTPKPAKKRKMQFEECLHALGVECHCDLEFSVVKKAFLREALKTHPDKATGTEAAFTAVHEAFEAIREATDNGKVPLADLVGRTLDGTAATAPRRSAEYYEAAAAAYPTYKVMVAPSSRGKCGVDGAVIEQGEIKVGSLIPELGDYGRFVRLANWSVPAAVQACLRPGDGIATKLDVGDVEHDLLDADGVIITGMAELGVAARKALAEHAADKNHWAKVAAAGAEAQNRAREKLKKVKASQGPSTALATAPTSTFTAPSDSKPDALKGHKFVLSGVFDDAALGLSAGKGDVKAKILALGGSVVGSLSKKVTALLVGSEPGAAKLAKAHDIGIRVLDVEGLRALIRGEEVRAAQIDKLSAGFGGKAVARRLTDKAKEALGLAPPKAVAPEPPAAVLGKRIAEDDETSTATSKKVCVSVSVSGATSVAVNVSTSSMA